MEASGFAGGDSLGDTVASGMPLKEIFEDIHKSNMTKVEGKSDQLGKAAKSNKYREPNLEIILFQTSTNCDGIEYQ